MALATGTPAPSFTLPRKTASGLDMVSLESGKKTVILFFPLAYTSVCTDEMCSVTSGLKDYEALDTAVYAISVDSPFAQEAWAEKNGIEVPVLSDFNKEVSEAYGVLDAEFLPGKLGFKGVAKRAAFVVGTDGNIAYSWASDDPSKLPPFDEIKAALA